MVIEVYKTMIVGSYRVFIDDSEYWCTPKDLTVHNCDTKRVLKDSSKNHKIIMEAVNTFIKNNQ